MCRFFDQAFYKQPGDKRTAWHRDAVEHDGRVEAGLPGGPLGHAGLTVWVPLDALRPTSGTLLFRSGSQSDDLTPRTVRAALGRL